MPGIVSREIAGGVARLVRLPCSANSRRTAGLPVYVKVLVRVCRDRIWGGWSFEGATHRPASILPEENLADPGLALECCGPLPGGRGHNRAPTLYILWKYDRATGEWREIARAASVERDWTLDLGPIASRELKPPRPVLVDTEASARRIMEAVERELEPLEFRAQGLVIRALQDRLAAGMAG